jgi:hypothetical protein
MFNKHSRAVRGSKGNVGMASRSHLCPLNTSLVPSTDQKSVIPPVINVNIRIGQVGVEAVPIDLEKEPEEGTAIRVVLDTTVPTLCFASPFFI